VAAGRGAGGSQRAGCSAECALQRSAGESWVAVDRDGSSFRLTGEPPSHGNGKRADLDGRAVSDGGQEPDSDGTDLHGHRQASAEVSSDGSA